MIGMDLHPDEIATRQFSRALLGANLGEVRRFLMQVAATLDRANAELARAIVDRTTLQTTLKETNDEVGTLRTQLAEAREKLAAYQGQESLMAQALINAQKAAEDLARTSNARAKQTLDEAGTTAQNTLRAARRRAAELLRTTRTRAQRVIEAADRAAEARIAEGSIEAERLAEEARRDVREAQEAARQQVEKLVAGLEAFLASREDLASHLDALGKKYADSLDVIGRMHTEVVSGILPAFRHLMAALTDRDGGTLQDPPVSPTVIPAVQAAPAPSLTATASLDPVSAGPDLAAVAPSNAAPARPAPLEPVPARPDLTEAAPTDGAPAVPAPAGVASSAAAAAVLAGRAPGEPAPPFASVESAPRPATHDGTSPVAPPVGEIIVSPVHSYLQATKLIIEVSKMKGVKAARLRTFSEGSIIIDVTVEAGALAAMDPRLINGVSVAVVEASDRRLVLRIVPDGGPRPEESQLLKR